MTLRGGTLTGGRLFVSASDVTVDGLTLRNGTAPVQAGNVHVQDVARVTVRNVTITDSAGACISFTRTTDSGLYDSELARCAQEGFHGTGNTRLTFARNAIHHNNPTNQYEPGWEAGAGKVTRSTGTVFEGNEVYSNQGFGIWCDIDCRDTTIRDNLIHHNTHDGIHYEISDGALITGNVVWENGWGRNDGWGWGAGILVSSSRNVVVRANTVIDNNRGVSVISQDRGGWVPDRSGNRVEGNDIVSRTGTGLAGWYQDWSGNLFTSTSGGANNRYWSNVNEPSGRYEWQGQRTTLAAYNATPGDEGAVYLTAAQAAALRGSLP